MKEASAIFVGILCGLLPFIPNTGIWWKLGMWGVAMVIVSNSYYAGKAGF